MTRDNGQVTPGVVSRQQAPIPDSGHPGAVKSESKPRGHERRSHVRNPPPAFGPDRIPCTGILEPIVIDLYSVADPWLSATTLSEGHLLPHSYPSAE